MKFLQYTSQFVIIPLVTIIIIITESQAQQAQEEYFRNPVVDYFSPDPFVTFYDGFYYLILSDFTTMTLLKSKLLTDFRNAESSVIYTLPEGYGNLWAPEIHQIQNNWYIYFAMGNGSYPTQRMHVMKAVNSSDIMGNYTVPIRLTQWNEDYYAIDGTVIQYNNGSLYFMYSSTPTPDTTGPQALYIVQMSDPMTLAGERVLIRAPTYSWEGSVIEAPQVVQFESTTMIIFSVVGVSVNYCLAMMKIDGWMDPMVPGNWWHKTDGCVFWKNEEANVYGPGHASFTQSPDGTESWIMYHAVEDPSNTWWGRIARVEKFTWNPDGSPSFPRPSGLDVLLPVPSGQNATA